MKSEMSERPGAGRAIQTRRLKPVPASRDRKQSDLLTGAVGFLLIIKLAVESWRLHGIGPFHCMDLLLRQRDGFDAQNSAIVSLILLFILTFAATRFGRSRKESLGVAERRTGRRASQVIANLGAAGLLAATGSQGTAISTLGLAACVAALAEATADTVSSEIGQALAGTRFGATILITSGRAVPPGTDGGISLAGTFAGILAAALVVMVSPFAYTFGPALCIFSGALAGLIFDSVLGATVERKGWLNNDLVNFASTLLAAAVAWAAHALLLPITSTQL
jgi:uncharacterized protein (TIGR00297 family)